MVPQSGSPSGANSNSALALGYCVLLALQFLHLREVSAEHLVGQLGDLLIAPEDGVLFERIQVGLG